LTKDILIQNCDLKEEIKDLRKRIESLEGQIATIEEEGYVTDSVTCGKKGKKPLGTVIIKGFPFAEYSRKKTRLYLNKAQLENTELELLEATNEVEGYIQSLNDSRIRRIIRHRFMDNMTWVLVSVKMGGRCTDDSVRKEFERFIIEK
jgi:chaperonin cofactor prefoldin